MWLIFQLLQSRKKGMDYPSLSKPVGGRELAYAAS